MQHSIYWIHCLDHTDIFTQGYVGISKSAEKRWIQHFKRSGNRHLNFAIEKYGWDNLVKEKIVIGGKDYCLDIERKLRSADGIGWNLVAGGGYPPRSKKGCIRVAPAWNKGIPWSAEARESIKNNVTKLWENPEYRQRMSNAHKGQTSNMKGKKHSAKSLLQMRLVKLGKPSSKKGFKNSAETVQRMRELAVKESWVCPYCNKHGNGKGAGNRWHFDNCRFIKETSWL
jgi:stalled ribosome alternative rescue factor ArfA